MFASKMWINWQRIYYIYFDHMEKLSIEPIDFEIDTLSVDVFIQELEKLKLIVEARAISDKYSRDDDLQRFLVEFFFNTVGEVKCISGDYSELNYGEFEVINTGGVLIDNSFYCIEGSERLRDKNHKYDPLNRLNLKHYVIIGQYNYVEVLAASYTFKKLMDVGENNSSYIVCK